MNTKDWSNRLIFATIIMSVVRYSAAFAASDMGVITGPASDLLTFMLALTGVGMGILDTAGGGFLFSGWSRTFPRNGSAWSLKFKVLTLCVFSLLFSGMFILVPFTMSRLAHESVLSALGGKESIWAWVWSAMVNFIPYVIVAGVFTGNRMVEQMDVPESSGKLPESGHSQGGKLPANWKAFRPTAGNDAVMNIAYSETGDIIKNFPQYALDERTARNWRKYARKELNIPQ